MSPPRTAAQLDPSELEEFQRAARLLLAHPLVTERWPRPGALTTVRRWGPALRAEFERVLRYHLDIGPACARLTRRSAAPSPHRGARTRTGRPFSPWAYAHLCLVLAAIESLGAQTTVSQLADTVLRLTAGDDAVPVDLTLYAQRRAFVDAVSWLEERGVLVLRDGSSDQWLAGGERGGDALYDIDPDAASRLMVASPSVLREVEAVEDFLVERYPPGEAGEQARLRHRVARLVVEQPVVYRAELDEDERAWLGNRRGQLVADLERLTGCVVESRAEGLALIDADVEPLSGDAFPNRGAVAHGALLLAEHLVAAAVAEPDLPTVGRLVTDAELGRAWARVVDGYGARFTTEYRDDPDRLRREAVDLLGRLDLVVAVDGGLVVRPALARFRPDITLPDPQPSFAFDA